MLQRADMLYAFKSRLMLRSCHIIPPPCPSILLRDVSGQNYLVTVLWMGLKSSDHLIAISMILLEEFLVKVLSFPNPNRRIAQQYLRLIHYDSISTLILLANTIFQNLSIMVTFVASNNIFVVNTNCQDEVQTAQSNRLLLKHPIMAEFLFFYF